MFKSNFIRKKLDLEWTLRFTMKMRCILVKIKEVSNMYHITTDTLRYYEKEGLLGPVQKDASGIRNYQEQDLKQLEFVLCMRSADIPIPELRRYLLLNRQGDKTKKERRSILTAQLERIDKRMAELETVRKKLKEKIKYYDEHES